MDTPDDHKRHKNQYGFGPRAPPENLEFPAHANLTAVEILTFLPNSVYCADVIYRFISNGGSRNAIWSMINSARDLPEEWLLNCCGSNMYKTMRRAGYEGWTVKTHCDWHDGLKDTWDEADLNVANIQGAAAGNQSLAVDIPFRELAVDVREMPRGYDALDLTRMVQYCERNPEENWRYPTDYAELLQKIGGPFPVVHQHTDRAVFKRWRDVKPPPPRVWGDEEVRDAMEALERKKTETNTSTRRKRQSGFQIWRDETPTAKGLQRDTDAHDLGMREGVVMKEELCGSHSEPDSQHPTQYMKKSAEYVAPPEGATAPHETAIMLAFAAERFACQSDAYSAYAFAGPRQEPPYRMLHEVGQPHAADTSGWAENLRWALEQRACFGRAVNTNGWNESPQHMERISKVRMEQVWASDELLCQLQDEDTEGEW